MADEDGDLLSGLPRSRPGIRSGKRDVGPKPTPAARSSAAQRKGPKRAQAKRAQPKARRKPPPTPPDAPPGAAEEALRLATGAAGAMLGTASSVTRGILSRLPKP